MDLSSLCVEVDDKILQVLSTGVDDADGRSVLVGLRYSEHLNDITDEVVTVPLADDDGYIRDLNVYVH